MLPIKSNKCCQTSRLYGNRYFVISTDVWYRTTHNVDCLFAYAVQSPCGKRCNQRCASKQLASPATFAQAMSGSRRKDDFDDRPTLMWIPKARATWVAASENLWCMVGITNICQTLLSCPNARIGRWAVITWLSLALMPRWATTTRHCTGSVLQPYQLAEPHLISLPIHLIRHITSGSCGGCKGPKYVQKYKGVVALSSRIFLT